MQSKGSVGEIKKSPNLPFVSPNLDSSCVIVQGSFKIPEPIKSISKSLEEENNCGPSSNNLVVSRSSLFKEGNLSKDFQGFLESPSPLQDFHAEEGVFPHPSKPPDDIMDIHEPVLDLSAEVNTADGSNINSSIRNSRNSSFQEIDMEIVNEIPGMNNHEGGVLMSIDNVSHD